jgi:uncharacterized damage-inducible protein DinB
MPAPDPFLEAARQVLDESLAWLRSSLDGVDGATLDRRPGGGDTNSMAVLAAHAMHSTRSWLSVAVGAPLPGRDRDAEFRRAGTDPDALLAEVDAIASDCRRLLAEARDVDWSALGRAHPRPRPGASEEVTRAWALVHALEHLKEHTGQLALTRQLLTRA